MTVALYMLGVALVVLFVGGPLNRIAISLEKQNAHYGIGEPEPGDTVAEPEE